MGISDAIFFGCVRFETHRCPYLHCHIENTSIEDTLACLWESAQSMATCRTICGFSVLISSLQKYGSCPTFLRLNTDSEPKATNAKLSINRDRYLTLVFLLAGDSQKIAKCAV